MSDSTQEVKADIKHRLIFFVGLTGHGKSESIGKLLDQFRRKQKPVVGSDGQKATKAPKSFGATTKKDGQLKAGGQEFYLRSTIPQAADRFWTPKFCFFPGLPEKWSFVDSPGWALGQPVEQLKKELTRMKKAAMTKAAREIQPVVVLVHEAEHAARLGGMKSNLCFCVSSKLLYS